MTESVNTVQMQQVPGAAAGRAQSPGKTASGQGNDPAVGKVAREFESLFIGMMLQSMRSTVGKDSLAGGGHGEEVYRSLLDQEYANAMASGSGIGLRKLIEEQLVTHTGDGLYHDNRTKP